MNVLEILLAAREKIATPDKWTQGDWSRDEQGRTALEPGAGQPVCWCLRGAINSAGRWDDNTYEAECMVEEAHGGQRGGDMMTFVSWQDEPGRTHSEVLALLDKTIARARYLFGKSG